MRKLLGKYVCAGKIPPLVGLLPVSPSLTQRAPGPLCFVDQHGQLGRVRDEGISPSARATKAHTPRGGHQHPSL